MAGNAAFGHAEEPQARNDSLVLPT